MYIFRSLQHMQSVAYILTVPKVIVKNVSICVSSLLGMFIINWVLQICCCQFAINTDTLNQFAPLVGGAHSAGVCSSSRGASLSGRTNISGSSTGWYTHQSHREARAGTHCYGLHSNGTNIVRQKADFQYQIITRVLMAGDHMRVGK